MRITLEAVQRAAREKGMSTIAAITLMQAGAAKLGDEATLEQLCEIKERYLDYLDGQLYSPSANIHNDWEQQ